MHLFLKTVLLFLATSSYDGMDDASSREIPTSPRISSPQGATAKCTNPAATSRYSNTRERMLEIERGGERERERDREIERDRGGGGGERERERARK